MYHVDLSFAKRLRGRGFANRGLTSIQMLHFLSSGKFTDSKMNYNMFDILIILAVVTWVLHFGVGKFYRLESAGLASHFFTYADLTKKTTLYS